MSKIFLRDTLSLSSFSPPNSLSHTYPPEPGPSNDPMPARPHPYRYQPPPFSPEDTNPDKDRASIVQIPQETKTSHHDNKKPLTHTISYPQPQPCLQRAPTRCHSPLPAQIRPLVLLLIFLPIPPLLSLLYVIAGHAILRQNHRSPTSIYHAPISSSIEAGATGGAILSLPIALILYLLISPSRQSSVPPDFFEDDDSATTGSTRWMMYIGYLASSVFLVGIGAIAGPLGVACLSSSISDAKKILSTGAAAAAGSLGGAVLSIGILLLGVLSTLVWRFWMRQHIPSS